VWTRGRFLGAELDPGRSVRLQSTLPLHSRSAMSTILTLHDPQTARGFYAQGWWRDDTFYSLLRRHAQERPGDHALRDSRRRLTWADTLQWVDTLAADLHAAGLKRGQRVSVWLPNRVEAAIVFLACSRNGYVCNPSLHQNYTVEEIVALLDRIQTAAFFAQPGYGADADRHDVFARARSLGGMKRVYRLEASAPTGAVGGDSHAFPAPGARADTPLPAPDLNPDKIVYLAFTSGTTGMPKGVLHSDNTLLANGRAMVTDWGHDHRTVLFSHSPLSHHIGTVALEQSLVAGFELVVNDPRPGQRPLDWILETGATYVMGVPTHAIDVLADMKSRAMRALGRVELFYMAGSVIPPETARAFLDLGIKPQNIYGMTENGSHQYTLPDDDAETITSTCGRAAPGYETRIFDPENPDIEAAAGATGEIGTRGALLMLGYFDNQGATENSFNAGGWFMSGDLGRLDARGNLQIVGRKKDLIIRGGHNIFPSRIENLMLRHPAVVKAAAFAVADKRLGERVCLGVILREGTQLDAGAALDHLDREGLSRFDMPEYFITMDAFPLTASGKILKRELVEWAKAGRIAPAPCRWVPVEKRTG
jgi:acyl-CoA synthetase